MPYPAKQQRDFTKIVQYGKIVEQQITPELKYLFTGQELKSEISSTSFWNFRARMFNSEIGLFYAPDPAHQVNSRYGYCLGNPINFVDPTGRWGQTSYSIEGISVSGEMFSFQKSVWGPDDENQKKKDAKQQNTTADQKKLNRKQKAAVARNEEPSIGDKINAFIRSVLDLFGIPYRSPDQPPPTHVTPKDVKSIHDKMSKLIGIDEDDPQKTVNRLMANAEADKVPQNAIDVLLFVLAHNGAAPKGYKGGKEYRNDDNKLPEGEYREYDVNPYVRGVDRGEERIVVEKNGKAYYTGNHGDDFTPISLPETEGR
jgi:RHS repeat-associated protein